MTEHYELAEKLHEAYIEASNDNSDYPGLPRVPFEALPIETQTFMLNMAENLVEDESELEEVIV